MESTQPKNHRPEFWLKVLIAVGIAIRLWPIFDSQRLFQHWPTEDGYLTLTISRNIATGLGMSVAAGTIPTNGTQPLATFLYTTGFWVSNGDRAVGVGFAQFLQIGFAAVTTFLLFKLISRALHEQAHARTIACVACAIWSLSPILVPHTMNCLETGLIFMLYVLLLSRWYDGLVCHHGVFGPRRALILGLLMGVCAWGRVDAVFLLVSVGITQLVWAWKMQQLRESVRDLSIMAAVAAATIFPWLLYGKLTFGHWIPISGVSEGHAAEFGSHAVELPAKLLELLVGVLGVPASLETNPVVLVGASLAVVLWGLGLRALLKHNKNRPLSFLSLACCIHLGLLSFYYGLVFGAPHFLSRYLSPGALFTIPVTVLLVAQGSKLLLPESLKKQGAKLALAACILCGILVAAQTVRQAWRALPHMHWQVVEWVQHNVQSDEWVGAVQTGTLGFFHDRTLNLDGKVDPRALEAQLRGAQLEYVVASPLIALVDWYGVGGWMNSKIIASNFSLMESDKKRDLSVMVRKGSPLMKRLEAAPALEIQE